MKKGAKITVVLFVLVILTWLGINWNNKRKKSSDLYENKYPFLSGWSDYKKELFKKFTIDEYAKWWKSEGKEDPQGNAEFIWWNGDATENNNWLRYWEEKRNENNLNENGF